VSEHLEFSRYADPGTPRHPWESEAVPEDKPGRAYSYAKATRYADHVVQLGPLADLVLAGDPLITSLLRTHGAGTWLRQFTRLHRPVSTLQAMRDTVSELREHIDEPTSCGPSDSRRAAGSGRSTPPAAASAIGRASPQPAARGGGARGRAPRRARSAFLTRQTGARRVIRRGRG